MRKHRGLSAVIGTVFLVAVVVSSLSYVTYSMNVLGNFSESLITEEKRQKDKQGEEFEITSVDITPTNKLDGVVKNTGQIPLEIKSLWIEEIGAPESVKKFDIGATIAPGNQLDLINSVDFDMDTTKGYAMKMVSGRGHVQSFYVNSPSSQSLMLNIHAIPEFVPSEFTTTVLFTVVNNMSNNNILYDLIPSVNTTSIGDVIIEQRSGPNPTSYPSLGPGEIATFEYIYQLSGDVDEGAIFNATIANAAAENFVITTALIKVVTLSTQSGTSLESFGLSSALVSESNILYFHDETDLTPGSGYQMDGSEPTGGGSTGDPSTTAMTFWSSNMTSSTVVTNGTWNSPLAYYSDLVPNGITQPSFAFMFECDDCGGTGSTSESTGNISGDDFDDSGSPIWHSTGGPHDDGYFTYDGNDYHRAEWDAANDYTAYQDISSNPVHTAIWARIPATTDNYMPIVRWGDENESNEDEYEIALGDGSAGNHGKIVYRFTTDVDTDVTTCVSTGSTVYDTNTWFHVIGVRPADDQCMLYINGVFQESQSHGSDGTTDVDVDDVDDIFIGFNGDADYLIGDVAMFMHWNNVAAPSATTAYDLYNTNYGTNGTRAHFTLQRTTGTGTVQETIYNGNFELDFHDPAKNSDSTRYDLQTSDATYDKYLFYNFTTTTLSSSTFATGERLMFKISWDSNTQNLPINIRFDDDDPLFTLPDASSYIQTPITTPNWPTYLTFDRDDKVTYYAFNNGPEGAWFNYQGTRFVLSNLAGTASYGGLVEQVNATSVNEDQDSIYIPDQNYASISFFQVSNPPQINPPANERVPVGEYNAAVFLSGYDDEGEAFLRTINLGVVSITD
jgi:hypothetical protein